MRARALGVHPGRRGGDFVSRGSPAGAGADGDDRGSGGRGGVGLHSPQRAWVAGGRIIAMDINDARLALAGELGADELVDARRAPFSEQVRALTGGEGADVVMEFVSNADTLPQSYRSIRKAGRLVFVGYTPGLPIEVMPHELVRGEFEIFGSRATTKQELADTMELVAQGRITPVVDRVFPLAEVESAFESLHRGEPLGRNVLAV